MKSGREKFILLKNIKMRFADLNEIKNFETNISIERMVDAIRPKEAIWNTNCTGYRNRALRSSLWDQVIYEIGLKNTFQNKKALITRWTNMKYRYSVWRKGAVESEATGARNKEFCYAEILNFLDGCIDQRRRTTEFLEDEDAEETPTKVLKIEPLELGTFDNADNGTEVKGTFSLHKEKQELPLLTGGHYLPMHDERKSVHGKNGNSNTQKFCDFLACQLEQLPQEVFRKLTTSFLEMTYAEIDKHEREKDFAGNNVKSV